MVIERIELHPLLHPLKQPYGDANGYKKYRSCLLFRIVTRSGIDGWGECVDWLPTLTLGFEQRIVPYLVGKQATDRLHLVAVISKWHQRAAAGVSMALTEILAKKTGVAICELWGGRRRDTVPVYASFQSYTDVADWQCISLARIERAIAEGFRQIKVKIGGRTLSEDQEHISRVQAQFQDTVQMALDANQSYDAAAACSWERLFRQWDNWLWLEEPLPLDRRLDYKRLRTTLSVPLAGGENLQSGNQFLPLLMEGALDMIQPDTMHLAGLDAFRETLTLARLFGVRASAHAYDGTLSRLYAIFAQACLSPWSKMEGAESEPIEWDVMENPFTHLIPLKPVNGVVQVPQGVGLGVEIDEEILAAYRWDGRIYH